MVAVRGSTYRIVARGDRHDVVRVLDDQLVGAFRHRPSLRVLESKVDTDLLLAVAKEAQKRARIAWSPACEATSSKSSGWLSAARSEWGWLLDLLICSWSGLPVLSPAPKPSAPKARA